MPGRGARDWGRGARRWLARTPVSYLAYRYRYLCVFTLIGVASIVLEIQLVRHLLPVPWPWPFKAFLAFLGGLLFSFALNAGLNFRVSRAHLLRTFVRFALVSSLSFTVNMLPVHVFQEFLAQGYGTARLVSSAILFLAAYTLHRRYTFDLARNFGVAVYAAEGEDVERIYALLGRNCDHVHVDLVDATMNRAAAAVDLDKLRQARRLWPGLPLCLHIMSLEPRRWAERTWDEVDWFLFHVNARDDLNDLIARCRLGDKKVGIVWHVSAALAALLPYLPHVDFVMVLGIAQPGCSGQRLLDEALAVTDALDAMRGRYGFEVMFDGGVSPATLGRIRARYVVAASAVLRAPNPVRVAHSLRSGVRYENSA